jgi:hypothetical protein
VQLCTFHEKLSGAHVAASNPETSAKLVKTIIYLKALYGCELFILNKTELLLSDDKKSLKIPQFYVYVL